MLHQCRQCFPEFSAFSSFAAFLSHLVSLAHFFHAIQYRLSPLALAFLACLCRPCAPVSRVHLSLLLVRRPVSPLARWTMSPLGPCSVAVSHANSICLAHLFTCEPVSPTSFISFIATLTAFTTSPLEPTSTSRTNSRDIFKNIEYFLSSRFDISFDVCAMVNAVAILSILLIESSIYCRVLLLTHLHS